MGLNIEDGRGSGRSVGVNAENRLITQSVNASTEHHINHHEEEAYNILISQSPTAANDCIFYLENTSETDICVEGIRLGFKNATAVDAEFYVKVNDKGTRNSSTDVTPTNLNAGSGKTAVGNFEYGADLDGGSATLTGGTEVERFLFADIQDQSSSNINFEQDLILPRGSTMTLWASDAGATYYVTVIFNYHNKDLS